jgi:short-subunit dehydrogenase
MPLRVFITGASSGLGAALALHYAGDGAIVGLLGRNEERLAAVAAQCGPQTFFSCADVADAMPMREAAHRFIERHGPPDIVIANAGVSIGVDVSAAEDLPVLSHTLSVNVGGLANTFQPFIESMRARHAGVLVGIGSVAGIRGLAGSSAYSASKAAAITWLESARLELRSCGIDVLTVCPGYVDTPMTRINRYRMPFLLSAPEAARRIARVIARRKRYAVVPWQMGIVACVLRALPRALYDRLFVNAPRKARGLPLD